MGQCIIQLDDPLSLGDGRKITLRELMDKTGCSRDRALQRITEFRGGRLSEKGLFKEYIPGAFRGVTVEGKVWSTTELSQMTGVSLKVMADRIRLYKKGDITEEDLMSPGRQKFDTEADWSELESLQPRRHIEDIKIGTWEQKRIAKYGHV